eukprot:364325-Chlamydomonas_euryale.AAC.4
MPGSHCAHRLTPGSLKINHSTQQLERAGSKDAFEALARPGTDLHTPIMCRAMPWQALSAVA